MRLIATALADDPEMERRIDDHRKHRPDHWSVVEEPTDVRGALTDSPDNELVVLDCLTLWLFNLMLERGDDEILEMVHGVIAAVQMRSGETIVVSNEVGAGLVPMHSVGRRFRDLQGRANRRFAHTATAAYFVVAGRALRLDDVEDLS